MVTRASQVLRRGSRPSGCQVERGKGEGRWTRRWTQAATSNADHRAYCTSGQGPAPIRHEMMMWFECIRQRRWVRRRSPPAGRRGSWQMEATACEQVGLTLGDEVVSVLAGETADAVNSQQRRHKFVRPSNCAGPEPSGVAATWYSCAATVGAYDGHLRCKPRGGSAVAILSSALAVRLWPGSSGAAGGMVPRRPSASMSGMSVQVTMRKTRWRAARAAVDIAVPTTEVRPHGD